MLVVPFRLSFLYDNTELFYEYVQLTFSCLWMMDIIVTFFTAIYQKGYLIEDLKIIAIEYISSGSFFFDILTSFPTELFIINALKDQSNLQVFLSIISLINFNKFLPILILIKWFNYFISLD